MGLQQALALLPQNVEIRIVLDNRISCALIYKNHSILLLEPRDAINPDFEFVVYPELIRMVKAHNPEDILALYKLLVAARLCRQLQFALVGPAKNIYKMGYLLAFKKLPHELQKEFMKYFLKFATQINQSAERFYKVFKK